MTALREAAQQALEFCESVHGGCTDSDDGTVEAITIWCPELIEALRAALKQEEEASAWLAERKEYWRKEKEKMQATNALRSALAQQDEPVERGAAYGDALRWAIKACGAVQRDDGVWFGDDAAARLARILSEGISPPQRMMVPLTDEEIEHIGMTHQSLRQVVRAVERAHGIKE